MMLRPPRWPFAFNADSVHARGAVLVSPMLHGLPPMDVVRSQIFNWSGTAPSSTVPIAVEGRGPLNAKTIDGNGSGYVDTGADYGMIGVNTLTLEWWMNEDGAYLGSDGTPRIAGNKPAGNTGWTAGRNSALGGPPGNATRAVFIIQGVAVYSPTTYDIPARQWAHVAITLNGTDLRFFVDGAEVGSATTGSMTAGGNIALLDLGAAGSGSTWINDAHSVVLRNSPLSAAEVAMRADPALTWDLYHELGRRTYFIPAAGGGPTGVYKGLMLMGAGM